MEEEEQILYNSIKTLLIELIKFANGKHIKLEEDPDIAKQYLGSIMRVEKIINSLENPIINPMALSYKDFFIITQFVQSSYRASQGNFLERIIAQFDDNKTISTNIQPKYLERFFEFQKLHHFHSIGIEYDDIKTDIKKSKKIGEFNFKSKKFAQSKIDIVNIIDNTLILAEQRSRVNTGGTSAVQSSFEKANLFLSEIDFWYNSGKNDLLKFFDLLKKKNINKILFLVAGLFSEDGDWGTFDTDPQLKAKKNEFKKITDKAEKLLTNQKIKEILDIKKIDFNHISLNFKDQSLIVEIKFTYGLEYLSLIYGKDINKNVFNKYENFLYDDFWVVYTIAIKENELRNIENTNHLEEMRKFLFKNTDFLKSWFRLKKKYNVEKFDELSKNIVTDYLEGNNWEKLDRISSNTIARWNYLKYIIHVLFMGDKLKVDLLQPILDI